MGCLLDIGDQSMDWASNNTGEFRWFNSATHARFSYAYRTLVKSGAMDICFFSINDFYLGMGIDVYRFKWSSSRYATKFTHTVTFDLIIQSILGQMVGGQTKAVVD